MGECSKGRATTRALPAAPRLCPPDSLPARPYDTRSGLRELRRIVGAGEDADVGMGPLWSPVLYVQWIGTCGRPSMLFHFTSH